MRNLFLFLLIIPFATAYGQHSKPDTIHAFFTTEKITLDGRLNEACWQKAHKISNFTQRELQQGAPASERTQIAIVYTKNTMYIGFWGYDDNPEELVAQEMARDFDLDIDDNFEVIISTFNDNRSGYLFAINPNGARADILIANEGAGFNKSWNGVWDVAVTRNDNGWFAEIEIPFSTLKFKKKDDLVWGINFERNIRRKNEQVRWQGWYRIYEFEKISQAGHLDGIKNIKAKNKFELKPYISGGVENIKGEGWEGRYKIGGDANFDITPTLKLNLTVNTDFAQVEADRARINLTRFSLYYPEKRQFFLEAKDLFEMQIGHRDQVFYSRRIGIEYGTEIPIIAGTRFFGKQDRTSIGVMSIQTAAKDSFLTTNYSVARFKQDIGNQSSVGAIMTSKILNGRRNVVYGANFTYSTSKVFHNKNLIFYGAFSQSFTSDSVNNRNSAYSFYMTYPNDVIEFTAALTAKQINYNPEMGFIRRHNNRMYYGELKFRPRPKALPIFRNLEFKPFELSYYTNDVTNELESIFYEFRPFGFATKSGEVGEINYQWSYDRLDEPFILLDSIKIPVGIYKDSRGEIQFETFKGRRLSAETFFNWGSFYTGRRTRLGINANLNVNKHWNLSAEWDRNFLTFDQASLSTDEIGGHVMYAYNPKLNSSLFGQYNNEDQEILLNFRINWIPKIGSDFYFVVNQLIDTSNHSFTLMETTVLAKLIWRFAL